MEFAAPVVGDERDFLPLSLTPCLSLHLKAYYTQTDDLNFTSQFDILVTYKWNSDVVVGGGLH